MAKIESRAIGEYRLDIKRCYVPFVVKDACPKCGAEVQTDLTDNYLSYPSIGSPERVGMWCEPCAESWNAHVVLGVTLTPVSP